MTFKKMIEKSVESGDTKNNIITDGTRQCTYHQLLGIFTGLDRFFQQSHVSPGECSVLVCGNTLPEALLLFWLLYRKRSFLLLPRGGLVFNPPEFCKHKILVDPDSPGTDINVPGTYLAVETNPGFNPDAKFPGETGSIFLKTSGSTAEPKLVMHLHEPFAINAANCVERFKITPGDRLLIPVPIYHMYALGAAILPAIIAGASINLLEKTNIITYLDREKKYQPNVSFLTPPLCDMFLRTRKSSYQYRLVVTAGDRITPTTVTNFETRFGKLVNLYGSTEQGAVATSNLDDPLTVRANGILVPMPGVTIDFADKQSEHDPECVSEIICHHEYGFDTYVDKKGQKITKETAKPFRTKDLGKRIAGNRFQVVGRTGNSVNRQGILVAFSEVESIMEQGIEAVAHAVVTGGQEDITRGKKMIAWCQLKPNSKWNNQDLRSRCFDIMPRHMVPDEIKIITEIPRLPNGKFDRKKLIPR